ncbi:MAG: hypothetical protein KBE00_02305 [Syntrophaceae bacterium]|nr:hypothetical protein [Syntrophaceae bacterium]
MGAESWNACPSGFPEKRKDKTSESFGGLVAAIVFALKRIARIQINLPNSQKDDTPPHGHSLTVSHFPFFKNLPSAIFPTAAGPEVLKVCRRCVFARRAGGFPIRT